MKKRGSIKRNNELEENCTFKGNGNWNFFFRILWY
jgi:hypothetical protein